MAKAQKQQTRRKFTFIVSDEANPSVKLKPGMKFEVQSVQLMDPTLKKVPTTKAALCGSSSTCVALIEVGE